MVIEYVRRGRKYLGKSVRQASKGKLVKKKEKGDERKDKKKLVDAGAKAVP